MAAVTSQATNSQDNPLAGFGPNEWIVEDMYQRYLADPSSVDPAWHDFFADYRPIGDAGQPRRSRGRLSEDDGEGAAEPDAAATTTPATATAATTAGTPPLHHGAGATSPTATTATAPAGDTPARTHRPRPSRRGPAARPTPPARHRQARPAKRAAARG